MVSSWMKKVLCGGALLGIFGYAGWKLKHFRGADHEDPTLSQLSEVLLSPPHAVSQPNTNSNTTLRGGNGNNVGQWSRSQVVQEGSQPLYEALDIAPPEKNTANMINDGETATPIMINNGETSGPEKQQQQEQQQQQPGQQQSGSGALALRERFFLLGRHWGRGRRERPVGETLGSGSEGESSSISSSSPGHDPEQLGAIEKLGAGSEEQQQDVPMNPRSGTELSGLGIDSTGLEQHHQHTALRVGPATRSPDDDEAMTFDGNKTLRPMTSSRPDVSQLHESPEEEIQREDSSVSEGPQTQLFFRQPREEEKIQRQNSSVSSEGPQTTLEFRQLPEEEKIQRQNSSVSEGPQTTLEFRQPREVSASDNESLSLTSSVAQTSASGSLSTPSEEEEEPETETPFVRTRRRAFCQERVGLALTPSVQPESGDVCGSVGARVGNSETRSGAPRNSGSRDFKILMEFDGWNSTMEFEGEEIRTWNSEIIAWQPSATYPTWDTFMEELRKHDAKFANTLGNCTPEYTEYKPPHRRVFALDSMSSDGVPLEQAYKTHLDSMRVKKVLKEVMEGVGRRGTGPQAQGSRELPQATPFNIDFPEGSVVDDRDLWEDDGTPRYNPEIFPLPRGQGQSVDRPHRQYTVLDIEELVCARSGSKIYGVSAIDHDHDGKKVTMIVKNEKKNSVLHEALRKPLPHHGPGPKNFWILYKERLARGDTLLMKFRHMFEFNNIARQNTRDLDLFTRMNEGNDPVVWTAAIHAASEMLEFKNRKEMVTFDCKMRSWTNPWSFSGKKIIILITGSH